VLSMRVAQGCGSTEGPTRDRSQQARAHAMRCVVRCSHLSSPTSICRPTCTPHPVCARSNPRTLPLSLPHLSTLPYRNPRPLPLDQPLPGPTATKVSVAPPPLSLPHLPPLRPPLRLALPSPLPPPLPLPPHLPLPSALRPPLPIPVARRRCGGTPGTLAPLLQPPCLPAPAPSPPPAHTSSRSSGPSWIAPQVLFSRAHLSRPPTPNDLPPLTEAVGRSSPRTCPLHTGAPA